MLISDDFGGDFDHFECFSSFYIAVNFNAVNSS